MSAKAMGRVFELVLTPAKQSVLLAMADHADHDGGSVKPSVGYIAWKTGYSERQTQRIIKALEMDGLLVPIRMLSGKPIEYRIDFSKGTPKPPYAPRKKKATPDKMSPPDLRQDVTHRRDKMSPHKPVEGVTSHENENLRGGDIASANLSRNHQKDEPVVVGIEETTPTTGFSADENAREPVLSPPTEAEANVWSAAFHQLEMQLDHASFETWLRGAELLGVETDAGSRVFVVGVRNVFARDMLQHRLYRTVQRVLSDVSGQPAELRFEVHEPAAQLGVADEDETLLSRLLGGPDASSGTPAWDGQAITPAAGEDTIRTLFERLIAPATDANESVIQHLEATYNAATFGYALSVMAAAQARGRVKDPLAYTLGILHRRESR